MRQHAVAGRILTGIAAAIVGLTAPGNAQEPA
jgi:hypothetical protein